MIHRPGGRATHDISEDLRPIGWGGDAQRRCLSPSFLMRESRVVGCATVRYRNLVWYACAARTPCGDP
jgi:hypothetical protein